MIVSEKTIHHFCKVPSLGLSSHDVLSLFLFLDSSQELKFNPLASTISLIQEKNQKNTNKTKNQPKKKTPTNSTVWRWEYLQCNFLSTVIKFTLRIHTDFLYTEIYTHPGTLNRGPSLTFPHYNLSTCLWRHRRDSEKGQILWYRYYNGCNAT